MKKRTIALPLALSSIFLLGACGEDKDVEEIEVNDPLLEDDGQNDSGVPDENKKNEDSDTEDAGS
ncbi:hypothetical protein AM499_03670 [Bacillus sp. FJAT-22090]|uniref:hypothetical protein n=1 Tax=Bacillus sp. FJAT-22090 TaxID=1581038 RepID=UPI0006AE6C3E|nr:hypothetical protein [Bacillus sp. FJAT-22090]ALC85016.1 hypothetical protein AM499_03670 [Bacillus sp. FJAT-22090]